MSKGWSHEFTAASRIHVSLESMPFQILPQRMKAEAEFTRSLEEARLMKSSDGAEVVAAKPEHNVRLRDPG